jgi:gluconate kinase
LSQVPVTNENSIPEHLFKRQLIEDALERLERLHEIQFAIPIEIEALEDVRIQQMIKWLAEECCAHNA